MGQNQANPFHEAALANDYIIQEKIPQLFLTFLKRKSDSKEYLLRELTFSELREFSTQLERLQKRKKIHHGNLTNLEVVEERAEDQMCSSFYKIYALWEYPKRTLIDDIAMRTLENRPYQQQQLWKLVTSCVPALSLLQQHSIWHECLTSKAVLFQEGGNIKVADPISYGLTTNLEYVLSNRYNKSIYLSPEQCDSIANHRPIVNKNPYKNDVFTFAMIVLEVGLLQKQDKCFQEDCSVINYGVLSRNVGKFGQKYGSQLQQLLEMMLDKSIQTRQDWLSLENVLKGSKMKTVGSATSNEWQNRQTNTQQTNVSSTRQPIVKVTLPPEPTFQKVYQGIPLSTIHSVSNEGSSSIRKQPSRLPSNQGQLYSNISSIPPYSFVSPISASQNTSNFNHLDRSQQFASNIQSYNPTPSMISPSFLPSHSNLPKSSSAIQSGPINIRFNSNLPSVTIPPRDMTATFGSTMYQQPPQIPFPNERITIQSPPLRVENEKMQSIPVSLQRASQAGSAANLNVKANEPKISSENELVEVYEEFSKGSRYKGYKLNGLRHGQGTFYYQDGGHYEGEWKFNRMNGYGRLFYQSDRLAYEGEWLDDQFHGRGKLYNESPQRLSGGFDFRNFDDIDEYWEYYEGQFSEDLKSGSGKLKFSNGELFEGTFVEDMVQGEGVFYCRDGQRIHAVWMENQLVQMVG